MKKNIKIILAFILINIIFLISTKVNAESEKLLENGFYQLKPKISEISVVDINGASLENGANAQIWSNSVSANQRFKLI